MPAAAEPETVTVPETIEPAAGDEMLMVGDETEPLLCFVGGRAAAAAVVIPVVHAIATAAMIAGRTQARRSVRIISTSSRPFGPVWFGVTPARRTVAVGSPSAVQPRALWHNRW